ncbi:type II toxin-antitoxin system HicB family antitoxin [Candidatus Woesearchaeota archaeon]|nr:type II toxin-antitoxin system HicB family antitoxin [Candidatus Woesearchaeota archaeon]
MTQIVLNVVIKEEKEGGYSAVCTDLDVASQGETVEEAISNVKEAVELYFESAEQLGELDTVLDRLGLTKEDLKKKSIIAKAITANVPIVLTV